MTRKQYIHKEATAKSPPDKIRSQTIYKMIPSDLLYLAKFIKLWITVLSWWELRIFNNTFILKHPVLWRYQIGI